MIAILLLGFLVGMKHALEADHVAAVATLATREASLGGRIRLAMAWGVGHAATLLLLGGTVLALGLTFPERVARSFEALVGLMLVVLGLDVLRRREVRVHRHRQGEPRALLVGSIHGLAGSAALVVLSLELTQSMGQALLYLITFALGSIVGMAALSLAISLPVRLSARRLGPAWGMVQSTLGVVTIGFGCWLAAVIFRP